MSDPIAIKNNEKPSDIEDDSDDETEGADEIVDSDSIDEKTDHQNGNASNSSINRRTSEQDDDTESLDPRIQEELEKLNSSTDVINKLEVDLEEARYTFRILMRESSQQLERLAKKVGPSNVEKARPYYDARMRARKTHADAQRAAARFEKASNAHEAAKEMVTLAEEGYKERGCLGFDQAWQEMLNHASSKVNESEAERNASALEHREKSMVYSKAESNVQALHRSLKKYINKSRTYFELKARFNQVLDDQKRQVQLIEETITMTKNGYSESLKELEKISEEIHQRRAARQQRCEKNLEKLGVREAGVGAENPPPAVNIESVSKSRLAATGDDIDGDSEKQISSNKMPSCLSKENNDDLVMATSKLNLDQDTTNTNASKAVKNKIVMKVSTVPNSAELTPKKQYLTVRRLSDDEISEADSMTSMDQLDDDQIEQLMLESDGFDVLEDSSLAPKT